MSPNCRCGECSSILESADPFLPGRALVVNTLALSRIWYVASIFGVPAWVVRELNILVFGFFWKGNQELVLEELLFRHPVLGAFLLFLYNSRFGLCWFSGSVALLLGALFSNTTLMFDSVPHCWTFYHTLQRLTRVGCHLFIAISCWRGRLVMVFSRLLGRPWQLVCPRALLSPPCPISPPSLSIPSYCRSIFLILNVSLSLHVILAPFIGLLHGISYFGLTRTGP